MKHATCLQATCCMVCCVACCMVCYVACCMGCCVLQRMLHGLLPRHVADRAWHVFMLHRSMCFGRFCMFCNGSIYVRPTMGRTSTLLARSPIRCISLSTALLSWRSTTASWWLPCVTHTPPIPLLPMPDISRRKQLFF